MVVPVVAEEWRLEGARGHTAGMWHKKHRAWTGQRVGQEVSHRGVNQTNAEVMHSLCKCTTAAPTHVSRL